jgi:small subunit ribosomal protein S21
MDEYVTGSLSSAVWYLTRDKGVPSLHVIVRGNDIDQPLKVLKQKMQREGIFRDARARSSSRSLPRRTLARGMRRYADSASLPASESRREGLFPLRQGSRQERAAHPADGYRSTWPNREPEPRGWFSFNARPIVESPA